MVVFIQMKTYVAKKTGTRFPANGCMSHFTIKGDKMEYFIRLGHPECSKGWKKARKKQFVLEEIPDLPKGFTVEQFKEYAGKYGVDCAQEFLTCCDYSKPFAAWEILNPPVCKWNGADEEWFQQVFGFNIERVCEPSIGMVFNRKVMDVIALEKAFMRYHGYNPNDAISMADFVTAKFGADACKRIQTMF